MKKTSTPLTKRSNKRTRPIITVAFENKPNETSNPFGNLQVGTVSRVRRVVEGTVHTCPAL
ncbi:hypothetical protein E2C01_101253 [Portunus trituberculatus]|uniref:Uncharacterized protein n=1 Tax=Portunus trituberculatus TaxID=210409 RepID=A0A5B7KF52_PORTR|nr:hypothetical protein [Portunus trituberculatus]